LSVHKIFYKIDNTFVTLVTKNHDRGEGERVKSKYKFLVFKSVLVFNHSPDSFIRFGTM